MCLFVFLFRIPRDSIYIYIFIFIYLYRKCIARDPVLASCTVCVYFGAQFRVRVCGTQGALLSHVGTLSIEYFLLLPVDACVRFFCGTSSHIYIFKKKVLILKIGIMLLYPI